MLRDAESALVRGASALAVRTTHVRSSHTDGADDISIGMHHRFPHTFGANVLAKAFTCPAGSFDRGRPCTVPETRERTKRKTDTVSVSNVVFQPSKRKEADADADAETKGGVTEGLSSTHW